MDASARTTPRRRLTRSAEFDRVVRHGRARAGRHLVIHTFPRTSASEGDEPRLGVSVGRRVGGAVERNRVKRLLRESFAALRPLLPSGVDFVVVARPSLGDVARTRGLAGVQEAMRDVLPRGAGDPGDAR